MLTTRIRPLILAVFAIGGTIATLAPPTFAGAAPAPAVCSERKNGGTSFAYGLTADQRLICFKVTRPSVNSTLMGTSSLSAPDTSLVGIDVRPTTGAIYGLGNAGGLYVLDPSEVRPTFKARLNVSLEGGSFGLDFNPTVDRLRVVSDSGQNLRVNVDTGATTVDGFLKFGANRALGVGGVAYTNNDNDASTATTLYDLDTVGDQLVTQVPPNDGTLVSVASTGFRGSSSAAFDIQSTIEDGKAVANTGYVALDGGGSFFRIDLKTAGLTFLGNLGTERLLGLTFPTN
jgi:hypothetical protein